VFYFIFLNKLPILLCGSQPFHHVLSQRVTLELDAVLIAD
jgi:hypothetical protein